jgi:integrase
MLVDEWVETVWTVLNVRTKTLKDYKHLYKSHLKPVIGLLEIDSVSSKDLQIKLLSLPPQTARHCLMLAKTIWREAENYGVSTHNPLTKLRTAPIQVTPKKFLTWEEVDVLDWGRYNNQIRFLALHGLRWSEAAALTFGDIKDGSVLVSRSVYGACKSKSSVRRVPYLGYFEQFPKSYKPMQKCANKHGVTVHSFRRSYAYLLKTQKIHVTTAQKLLGHSDPIMTLKVYTSVLDNEIDEAGEVLSKFILGNTPLSGFAEN